jgi:hypothetical protein
MTARGGTAINNTGQVAGYGWNGSIGTNEAVIWNGTTPTVLGDLAEGLGTSGSAALGINNNGQVEGLSHPPSNVNTATIWKGTTATALGTLPNYPNSMALGINDAGVASDTLPFRPVPPLRPVHLLSSGTAVQQQLSILCSIPVAVDGRFGRPRQSITLDKLSALEPSMEMAIEHFC